MAGCGGVLHTAGLVTPVEVGESGVASSSHNLGSSCVSSSERRGRRSVYNNYCNDLSRVSFRHESVFLYVCTRTRVRNIGLDNKVCFVRARFRGWSVVQNQAM